MVKDMVTGYPSIDRPWRKYYSKEAFDAPLPECTAYEFFIENGLNQIGIKIDMYRQEHRFSPATPVFRRFDV